MDHPEQAQGELKTYLENQRTEKLAINVIRTRASFFLWSGKGDVFCCTHPTSEGQTIAQDTVKSVVLNP